MLPIILSVDSAAENQARLILVADDDPQVRHIMGRMLRRAGYAVLFAATDDEAVERFESELDRIELVVLDLGLARGGAEATLERMLEISTDFAVLIASGEPPSQAFRRRLRQLGGGFLTKPFRATALSGEVQRLLAAKDD
ncbi:MAG: response regulator [Myxococcota bacterium]|nr:response regulator [Myxococcota bacterium]